MSAITMSSATISYQNFYDDENFQQECLNMSSLGQPVNVSDFDPIYSNAFSVPYSGPVMVSSPTPLSIYTTNLDNFSNSSLSSAATSVSSYYSDLGFGQCVDNQWHVDDGYVSGGTSPTNQSMSHDAFYPMSDQPLVLLDGTSLANIDMSTQIEPNAILADPTLTQTTPDQLQYAMFDPVSQSPDMSVGLNMIDPLSTETYVSSSVESSPVLSAARSKSIGSRSPTPPSQQPAYYSTFDNKGSLMKCPHKGCTKSFGRVYNLKTHLKSHVSTKPWECPMCPRSFTRKHDLQRHVRVHTGQKPYVCPCCSKRFARTDALTRHIRVEDSCRLSEEVANYKGRRRYSDLS